MKILILLVTLYVSIICIECDRNNDCPRIKSKGQWEGVSSNKSSNLSLPIQNAIIHHTVSKECKSFVECSTVLQNIQSYHILLRGFDDIGYNFMIGNDGLVYEGRGWNKIGNHTRDYNAISIGIAFIGNFTNKLPPHIALNALKQLLRCGVNLNVLRPGYKLLAARQVSNTVSPGFPIFEEIQEWDNWADNTQ